MIFGVWISTKPAFVSVSRKRAHTPASSLKMAWFTLAKFPSSTSVTLLPASSICRGSWGSLADTTHTCFTCSSTSCWLQLSIFSSTLVTTASTSMMLSFEMWAANFTICLLTENHEALLSLRSARVQPASHCHHLPIQLQTKLLDVGDNGGEPLLGHVHLLDPVFPLGHIRAFIFPFVLPCCICFLGLVSSFFCSLFGLLGVTLLLRLGLFTICCCLLRLLVLLLLLALPFLLLWFRSRRFPVKSSSGLKVGLECKQRLDSLINLSLLSLGSLQSSHFLASSSNFCIKFLRLPR